MMQALWIGLVIFFISLNTANVSCILNSSTEDITHDSNIFCNWSGGTEPGLHCHCLSESKELFIKERSIPQSATGTISISDCNKIRVGRKAIIDVRQLREITFTDINSLILEEESMYWTGYDQENGPYNDWDPAIPSLSITITNASIEEMKGQAFKGRINKVAFKNVTLQTASKFAFSSLHQLRDIEFDSVLFKELPPQTFKKFEVENLSIKNSQFGVIPSKMFYDITVKQEFILQNISIEVLNSAGFTINNPRYFELSDSFINNFLGEGLRVSTRGDVFIKNNEFNHTSIHAFSAITSNIEDRTVLQRMIFDKNIFHEIKGDLIIDKESFNVQFNDMQVTKICDCVTIGTYIDNNDYAQNLKCTVGEDELISILEFKRINCSFLDSTNIAIFSVVGVFVIVFIIVISLVAWQIKRNRKKKKNDKSKLGIIVPDGRTYRETELHVIVERTDLLTTDL